MILAALALLAAADPCSLPAPAAQREPEAAQAYVEAGEAEAGQPGALVAFREALRLDPDDARARRGFSLACAGGEGRFEAARRLMDAGDRRSAVVIFEALRADEGPAPRASLLEGICLYELGDDARARPRLSEALARPALADSARFFLGMIALRAGDDAEAVARLSQVRQGSAVYGDAQRVLLGLRGRRLSFSALADSGYDSNVTLAPSGVPGGGDATSALSAALLFRPLGEDGPFARAAGSWHLQLQHHDYDVLAFGGAAGYQLGSSARHLSAEYDYDYVALGAAPYLSAHRLGLAGRTGVGDGITLGASYAVRFESYLSDVTSAFSGTLHTGEVRLAFGAFEVAYHAGRDFTVQDATSYFEHGPRALLRADLSRRFRATLTADALLRGYDAVDPSFAGPRSPQGVRRSDVLVDGNALGEYDLSDQLTLRFVLGGRDAVSNVSTLSYLRIYATVGLSWATGLW